MNSTSVDAFDINSLMRPKRVCLCNLVTEKELVDAIKAGCHTFEELRDTTRATTGCGTCTGQVMEILQRELKTIQSGQAQ